MFFASFLRVVAALLWASLVAYIGYIMVQRSQGRRSKISVPVAVLLLIAAAVVSTLSVSMVVIDAGEVGVVFNIFTGTRPGGLGPGTHFVSPYINQVFRYPVMEQAYTMTSNPSRGESDTLWSPTIEGLKVGIDSTTRYRIDPEKAAYVHNNFRNGYMEILIRPTIRSIVRHHISQNTVTDVYGPKRAEIQEQITEALREQLESEGFELLSFDVRNIIFTEEYSKAIEQKQVAQQEAEQMKFVLQREEREAERREIEAEGVKQAAITKAEGEAEALRLINEQIAQNENLITYRYIEKLSPNIRVMMVPSGSPFMLNLEGLQGQMETEQTGE
ncbi:MAG: prohibitin family protein [Chloroflexota bacterium]|nr:prohibitin family protein [Chloroflexota bacterium]